MLVTNVLEGLSQLVYTLLIEEHAACMGGTRHAYRVVLGKLSERHLKRRRRRCEEDDSAS
jgi:hypothetical protein